MTKFEEDLNKKMDLKEVPMYFTQSGCSMTRKTYIETNWIFDNYKNWHSDEEFQEMKESYWNQAESILSMLDEIKSLKSQLQQQALPVVPECVAEIIEYAKNNKKSIRWFFTEDAYMFPEAMDWYAGSDKGLVDDIYAERQCSLINAFITGKYQVEKPQLFYLKHIDMSKRNSINDLYLKKYIHADLTENGEHRLSHAMSAKGMYPPKDYCAFTQQEIDSMQTGSYEQIEVAE